MSNSSTKDTIMNAQKKRLNLLTQDSIVYSKIHVVLTIIKEPHVHNTCLKSNLKINKGSQIPSHKKCLHINSRCSQFEAPESCATLTVTKMNTMQDFTHIFVYIYQ